MKSIRDVDKLDLDFCPVWEIIPDLEITSRIIRRERTGERVATAGHWSALEACPEGPIDNGVDSGIASSIGCRLPQVCRRSSIRDGKTLEELLYWVTELGEGFRAEDEYCFFPMAKSLLACKDLIDV